jgi:hypothetical protein
VKYLRMSYRLGPNEGWIALKRSWAALSVYPQLPPDIAGAAIDEFAGLLSTGLYSQAAAILEGPGWKTHDQLLDHIKSVSLRNRQALANIIYRDGYYAEVPGVPRPDPRPWN